MSTTWGSYVAVVGAVSARAGMVLSFSPATVTGSTTSVTVSGTLQLQQSGTGFASGNDAWSITGGHSASGTKSWSTDASGQVVTIATFTKTVSLIYGQSQVFTVSGEVTDVGPSANDAKVTGATITIPARPVSAPALVSGLTVTRFDDSRQTINWTQNATTTAPYDRVKVWRAIAPLWEWGVIADLPSDATGFNDRGTQAGRLYRYGVEAVNSAGSSGIFRPEAAGTIATTPLTPSAPTATKQPSGDVVVTRPALSYGATWSVRHVETGTVLATGLTGATWAHTNPSPMQTWTYDIRASSATPVLHSAWSANSATIQLIAAPLAPTPLVPAVADPAEAITLTWQHNPQDGTPQRLYQVQTRASSGDVWTNLTALPVSSTTPSHTVAAGTWAGQTSRQWRVMTWGQHDDPSPYSQTAVLVLSARPVVDITYPTTGHNSPSLSVSWSFYDAEGSNQTQRRVTLFAGAGTSVVLEQRSAVSSLKGQPLTTQLADGGTYTVQVDARDGAGLWSTPATRTFTVTYAPPPDPLLSADFRADDGYTVLTPVAGPHEVSKQILASIRVERATPDGWLVVADNLDGGQAVVDMLPPLGTVVTYRAVAVSTIGSVAYSVPVAVDTSTRWVFINHGPGFGQVCRIWGNLEVGRSYSRAKTLKRYAGRALPVERAGNDRNRAYNLTGTLFAPWAPPDLTSSWEDFEAAADAAAPVCVRDPEGVKMFVSTGGPDLSGYPDVTRRVSLPMTQVDYPEDTV